MTKYRLTTWCTLCGEALVRDSFQYRIDGQWVCRDCLEAFAIDYFRWALEPVG